VYTDAQLRKWWGRLSDGHRTHLREAIRDDDLEPTTVSMLAETKCPVGTAETTWNAQPEYGWSWPTTVRTFIAER
jgi:hypothetical protein